jgi:predicted DNA-binding transcriptional regulator AlpA
MARLGTPVSAQFSGADQLLDIKEASRKLKVSVDYLYRHKDDYPFTRRMGRKLLFSSRGIDEYIASHPMYRRA